MRNEDDKEPENPSRAPHASRATGDRPRVVVVDVESTKRVYAARERRPTNREIVEHAAHAMDAASSVATTVGAEGAAEVLQKGAHAARAIPVAIDGVKREIAPAKAAVGNLWNAMERRGWVGTKEPVNLGEMQHRNRQDRQDRKKKTS